MAHDVSALATDLDALPMARRAPQPLPALLTIDEVKDILRLKRALTVRTWIRSGRLPHVRIGYRILIRRHDLEKMVGMALLNG
jgi:excisionase family DNA binding protein